jgi:DNA-binding transcriptional LysR family regulator
MLDIHALQVFCEAAHANNFTLAAKKLNMTQPAVSMQIKTLEDQLQVKLFERHGRSMQVTQAGQALIPRARHIIALAIQTEELMRAAQR